MSEEEKEKTILLFIYRILNDQKVLNRFGSTRYGNIFENRIVTLGDCIKYLENKFDELGMLEKGEEDG